MKDIVFECPDCKQLLEAPGDMVEMFVECPKCQSVIKVPKDHKPVGSTENARTDPPVKKDNKDEESLKGSTIRIDLPPNLGIPEAPKRKFTIRRKS